MTETTTRGLFVADAAVGGDDIQRWAIVVGISTYQSERLTLKYADRDAEDFATLLQTPLGGNFAPDHVEKLVNDEATTFAITRALRSFLKKPSREDVVIIYFACHGAPDPDRPANLYLLTHDTDPDDIAGTALPMREIDLALRENLLAERVVVLADTCHSAGLGGGVGRRNTADNAGAFNTYLQAVSQTRGGVALLTSAEANETAQEGAQWGGGHGVFTHYLLQGLLGDADGYGERAKDGIVTVGELFDYVRANVTRATNNSQHPALGTAPFDRSLPLAITGGETAREHFILGLALSDLGAMLNEPMRHIGAIEQLQEALRLARRTRTPFVEAELALAISYYHSGNPAATIRVLDEVRKRDGENVPPELYLWRGVAAARQRDYTTALRDLSTYLKVALPDDEQRGWIGVYLEWLNENRQSQNHALLIGINTYQMPDLPSLSGCINDGKALREVLIDRYEFDPAYITWLTDEQATYQQVVAAFRQLAEETTPADTVIVHFSGHALTQTERTPDGQSPNPAYLIFNDTDAAYQDSMGAHELHELLNAIPAERKILLLDTHPHADLLYLGATEGTYKCFLASDTAEDAYEYRFAWRGTFTVMGLFTGVLVQQLEEANRETLTFGELVDGVIAGINDLRFRQTPLFRGDREAPVFVTDDNILRHFEFGFRRRYFDIRPATLMKRYQDVMRRIPAPFPRTYLSFGWAFIEKGDFILAVEALRRGIEAGQPDLISEVTLAYALWRSEDEEQAGSLLQSLFGERSDFPPAAFLELGTLFFQLGMEANALRAFAQADSAVSDYLGGIIYGKQGDYENAHRAFETFLQRGDFTAFHAEGAKWYLGQRQPSHYVLLVGVEQYRYAPNLPHAVHSVSHLREWLKNQFGVPTEQIITLINEQATLEKVVATLQRVTSTLMPDDRFTLYIASHVTQTAGNEGARSILHLLYDSNPNTLDATLEAQDILNHLPAYAGAITVLTETTGQSVLDVVAQRPNLTLLAGGMVLAEDPPLTTPDNLTPFMSRLSDAVQKAAPSALTGATLLSRLKRTAKGKPTLNPQLAGNPETPFFTLLPALSREQKYQQMFETMRQVIANEGAFERYYSFVVRTPIVQAISLLEAAITDRAQVNDPFPEGRLHIGVAYSALGDYATARQYLEQARRFYEDPTIWAQEEQRDPNAALHRNETLYQLGRVLAEGIGDYDGAVSLLRDALQRQPTNASAWYYLGYAIWQQIERRAANDAAFAYQTYLELGAPLGQEDEVRRYLARDLTR